VSANPRWESVSTAARFEEIVRNWRPGTATAVDIETNGLDENAPGARILGVSIAFRGMVGVDAVYVPLHQWSAEHGFTAAAPVRLNEVLCEFLRALDFAVGANYAFDKDWILRHRRIAVNFRFDVQVGWHHSDAPAVMQGYGLKRLQTALLGWERSGEKALHASVRANGGDPKKGEFYKAAPAVLAEYAALDAWSTLLGFEALFPFFQKNGLAFHDRTCAYRELLRWNTREGIVVDRPRLEGWVSNAQREIGELQARFTEQAAEGVRVVEDTRLTAKMREYKTERGWKNFLATQEKPRFNLNSNPDLAKLFYDALGFDPPSYTPSGQPQVNRAALEKIPHPAAKTLVEHNRVQKALEYGESYLASLGSDGRLHPGFNVTGTVSGRLSGFSPNVQQMPLDERELMECFHVPEGRVGVGADLTSIEPFFTAFYSDDPTLLKVYRDHLGDIYLDLALDLFPDNSELRDAYDPLVKPSEEVKKRFADLRFVSKTVHLAAQYGAGGRKIAAILGCPESEGYRLHRLYWRKFQAVKKLEAGLYRLYQEEGQIVNPFGRIIRLPGSWCKDLLSRFIQSTAHDALVEWVMNFEHNCAEAGTDIRPLIVDWHDATYWHVDARFVETARGFLHQALDEVTRKLELPYPIRCVSKTFDSLAGIK
jgi:DNA polymerase I-like protein with 3'-5' exonuclease and polymerase domains